MAKIPGLNITAPVVPSQDTDTYPSHRAIYGYGGWREVATVADRDAIPALRREAGMAVYVTSEKKLYILNSDLVTWSLFSAGGVVVMPTPSETELGNIVQYIGETTQDYTQGYFYKCISDGAEPATYSWKQIDVQPHQDISGKLDKVDNASVVYGTDENGGQTTYGVDSFGQIDNVAIHGVDQTVTEKRVDLSVVEQVESVPNASEGLLGRVLQYTGATTANYTNGYFYECVTDGEDPATYSWERVSVQPETEIVDNVITQSSTSALSANMGYELQQQISNLQGLGRYLSVWDCTTGLPDTDPTTNPYEYKAGDYYIVGHAVKAEPESCTIRCTHGQPEFSVYWRDPEEEYKQRFINEQGYTSDAKYYIVNTKGSPIASKTGSASGDTSNVSVDTNRYASSYIKLIEATDLCSQQSDYQSFEDIRFVIRDNGWDTPAQVNVYGRYRNTNDSVVSVDITTFRSSSLDPVEQVQEVKNYLQNEWYILVTGDLVIGHPWGSSTSYRLWKDLTTYERNFISDDYAYRGLRIPFDSDFVYDAQYEDDYVFEVDYRVLKQNFRPNGSSYTIGVPSETVETLEVGIDDSYIYDGLVWHLLSNGKKEITFTEIVGSPYDNVELANALDAKVDDVQVKGAGDSDYHSVVIEKVAKIDLVSQGVDYTFDAVPSVTSVKDALDDLMNRQYYVEPSFSTFTTDKSGSYERQISAISDITFSWTLNKTPATGDVLQIRAGTNGGTSGDLVYDIIANEPSSNWKSGTYNYSSFTTTNTNKSFHIYYKDNHSVVPSGKSSSTNANTSITFYIKKYYGASALEEPTATQIKALKSVTSSRTLAEEEFNFGDGKYWYYCIPKETDSGAALKFSIGAKGAESPQSGNYFIYEMNDFTNAQGYTVPLRIYKFKKTPAGLPDKITGSSYVKVD